jgi:hypothetical protein
LRDRLAAELGLMQRFRALLSSPASALADDLRGAVQNGELTLREAAGCAARSSSPAPSRPVTRSPRCS